MRVPHNIQEFRQKDALNPYPCPIGSLYFCPVSAHAELQELHHPWGRLPGNLSKSLSIYSASKAGLAGLAEGITPG